MPTELIKVLHRRRAEFCLAVDLILCSLGEILCQIAHSFNIGEQVLQLEAAPVLTFTEILLNQAIDKGLQKIGDGIYKLVLLLEYPLSSVHIIFN